MRSIPRLDRRDGWLTEAKNLRGACDQRVYMSDTRRAVDELDWTPRVPWTCGLDRLFDWVWSNAGLSE